MAAVQAPSRKMMAILTMALRRLPTAKGTKDDSDPPLPPTRRRCRRVDASLPTTAAASSPNAADASSPAAVGRLPSRRCASSPGAAAASQPRATAASSPDLRPSPPATPARFGTIPATARIRLPDLLQVLLHACPGPSRLLHRSSHPDLLLDY
ncbi:hypothetical protein GUJ93_ZPchr0011g28829 [Zizania palustris]|uniref:Uncharacterized protein n=1 Tax=Zizania palustris TaxID=103762 RepID=A0A8J5WHJ0_ZIZPA|nr:hypothetical protein GUJ93_ZPchr0011g28829 [Zizania palustris]